MERTPCLWTAAVARASALAIGAFFLGALLGLAGIALRHPIPIWGYPLAAAWALLALLLVRLALRASVGRCIAACLIAAAILRVGVLAALNALEGVATGNDYAAYLMLARNLADGNGLLAHTMNYGWARGLYPPLYPLLLSGAGAVAGFGAATILALNSAIDLGSAWLLLVIGRRLGRPRAGLAAAALFLIWPSAAIVAPLAQKEGLVTLLALFLALVFHKLLEEGPGWRNAALLGLGTALMALAQPGLAPLPLSIALVLLPTAGPRLLILFGARAAPFAIAAMLPWWIRNYLLFGAFVPFTTSMGPAMMSALGAVPGERAQLLVTGDEPAQSARMVREAGALIVADPLGFVAERIPHMARQMIFEDYDALRLAGFSPPIAWARAVLPAAQLALAGAAGLAFAALALKRATRGDGFLAAIVLACLLHIALFDIWFEFGERHRHFVTPFLLLLAGSFAVRIMAGSRAGRQEKQGPGL
jgi:hypothetical protein